MDFRNLNQIPNKNAEIIHKIKIDEMKSLWTTRETKYGRGERKKYQETKYWRMEEKELQKPQRGQDKEKCGACTNGKKRNCTQIVENQWEPFYCRRFNPIRCRRKKSTTIKYVNRLNSLIIIFFYHYCEWYFIEFNEKLPHFYRR